MNRPCEISSKACQSIKQRYLPERSQYLPVTSKNPKVYDIWDFFQGRYLGGQNLQNLHIDTETQNFQHAMMPHGDLS